MNKNEIQYKIDKTNFENEFTRNSIRLDLIPFIEERYNIKFKDKIFSLIEEIRENNQNNSLSLSNYAFVAVFPAAPVKCLLLVVGC